MKELQIDKIGQMLQRPGGCTMMEVIKACNTSTPTRRLSDLRDRGWIITKHKVEGKNYHRFYGQPPKKFADYIPKTVWVDAKRIGEL
jgi:hypothetical protein